MDFFLASACSNRRIEHRDEKQASKDDEDFSLFFFLPFFPPRGPTKTNYKGSTARTFPLPLLFRSSIFFFFDCARKRKNGKKKNYRNLSLLLFDSFFTTISLALALDLISIFIGAIKYLSLLFHFDSSSSCLEET